MDDGLKQRLVGAVVLSAVAVLFVPVLFDQHDKHKVDTVSQIPALPNIDPVQYESPTRTEGVDPAPKPQQMFLPQGGDAQVVDAKPDKSSSHPKPFVAKAKLIQTTASESANGAAGKTKAAADKTSTARATTKSSSVKPNPVKPKATAPKPKPKSSTAKPSTRTVRAKTESAEVLNADGTPNAWVLQLISSSSETKAKTLVTQLQNDNYSAYYRSAKTPKGVIYRVYVGPKINRRKAEGLKRELDKRLKVDALILRFQP